MKRQIVRVIATGFFSGYLRPFPGTWGTMPALLIAFFILETTVWNPVITILSLAIGFTFISVWAAGEAEKEFGHDARNIVIDEWAGMFVTLILVPQSLLNFAVAFVFFRMFDVVKIPPARQLESLPGGWGVTMDDIVAGVHANIATHLSLAALARLNGWTWF